jgi:hypothetical protein
MNASTMTVNFFPFLWCIVGLSPGTFWVHAHFVVHGRVNLAGIPKTTHQVQPCPVPKVPIVPAVEVLALERNQSQKITTNTIDTLNNTHAVEIPRL